MTGRRHRIPGGERGIALVVVLWGLTLLSIIAASFAATSRTGTTLARNVAENAKARALAEAGIHRAILGLTMSTEGEQWRADGTVYPFPFADGAVSITIQDEWGKVDLNRGTDFLIGTVFLVAGADQDTADALVEAIKDFRDRDDARRVNGAEDAEYEAAGLSHGAKDAPFEAIEELQQVLGMTPELYRNAAPLLTVHSRQRGINPATASQALLTALPGAEAGAVDDLIGRRGENGGSAVADFRRLFGRSRDVPFTSSTGVSVATVRAEARTEGGAVFIREAIVRVISNPDQPYLILSWGQGRPVAPTP